MPTFNYCLMCVFSGVTSDQAWSSRWAFGTYKAVFSDQMSSLLNNTTRTTITLHYSKMPLKIFYLLLFNKQATKNLLLPYPCQISHFLFYSWWCFNHCISHSLLTLPLHVFWTMNSQLMQHVIYNYKCTQDYNTFTISHQSVRPCGRVG